MHCAKIDDSLVLDFIIWTHIQAIFTSPSDCDFNIDFAYHVNLQRIQDLVKD